MNPFLLRVLLAADAEPQTAFLEEYLREAGHEVTTVAARGDAALNAARLVRPDLVVLSGPLRGALDGVALAAALQAGTADPVPVMLITDPAELPGLLPLPALHPPASARPPKPGPADLALNAALERAGT